jgi:hypothetical protein
MLHLGEKMMGIGFVADDDASFIGAEHMSNDPQRAL